MPRDSSPGQQSLLRPAKATVPPQRTKLTAGDLVVFLVAVSAIGSAVAAKALDHAQKLFDYQHQAYWHYTGNRSGAFAAALLALALVCAGIGIANNLGDRRLQGGAGLVVTFLSWWVFASLYNGVPDGKAIQNLLGFSVLVLGVVVSPPSKRSLVWLGWLYVGTMAGSLAYGILIPDQGTVACRPDKCGIFGSLMTGFFPQENVLGIVCVALLPTIRYLPGSRWRIVATVLSALVVLGTGSRTSLAGWMVAAAATIWLIGWRPPLGRKSITLAPMAAFIAAAFLFLTTSADGLTGRGVVYQVVRSHLVGWHMLTGSGPGLLKAAYLSGATGGYEFVEEHNEVGHLLNNAGVIGALIFLLVLVALVRRAGKPIGMQAAAIALLVAASSEFMTEAVWTLEIRSEVFCTLLIVFGTVAAPSADETADGSQDESGLASPDMPQPGRESVGGTR